MKQNYKWLIASSAIIASAFFASCKKTETPANSKVNSVMSASGSYEFSDFPTLEDGILKFRDNDHYDSYIDFLDQVMVNNDPDNTDFDLNEALLEVEKGLGFTSLRNITHADFMKKDEIGWSSAEQIPEEHFLASADLRSVLNQNLEVQIGEDIVHYINRDYAVRVDARQKELLGQFRALSFNASLDDIRLVDKAQQFTSIIELTGIGHYWEKPIGGQTLGTYNIATVYCEFKNPCTDPYRCDFKPLAYLYHQESRGLEGSISINYGDGSPTEEKPILHPSWYYETAPFSHVFLHSGTLTMTIRAYNLQHQMQTFTTKEIVVKDAGCQAFEKNSYWQYKVATNNADHMVGGRLRIEIYGGNHNKMRMISETKSYVRKSGNVFHLGKGRIEVNAKCSAKDEFCNEIDFLQAYQLKTNSKELLEHRSKSSKFSWKIAESEHSLTLDGVVTTLPLSITTCQ